MRKVFIVDNDPTLLRFVTARLEKAGHEVVTANDGLHALEVLKTFTPEILFVDLVMPKIDGDKLCQIVRNIPSLEHAHVVIVSAAVAEMGFNYKAIGADACIAKESLGETAKNFLCMIDHLDVSKPFEDTQQIMGIGNVYNRQITKELLSANRHLGLILENASEGILEVISGVIIYANTMAARLLETPAERLLATHLADYFEDNDKVRIESLIQSKEAGYIETGDDTPLELNDRLITAKRLSLISEYDSNVIFLYDITERKQNEARIRHLALHDTLTDLPNRNLFYDRLANAINRSNRYQSMVALLFIDLDRFKPVNDTFGHMAGDMVLQTVALRILDCIRKTDTAARIGGDEFAVILPDIEQKSAAASIAQKIIHQVTKPIRLGSKDIALGVSIGISTYPDEAQNADILVQQADLAMYNVKRSEKNGYRFYRFSELCLDC